MEIEILNRLLSSELLSEEARAEITEQWEAAVDGFKSTVREEVELACRAEIAEQWAAERDVLITNVESFVQQKLQEEVEEFHDEINRFRDLEADYAEKLVEERHNLREQLSAEMDSLIDKIDDFLEMRLQEEYEELKEDLAIQRQNQFGSKVFEAFMNEYQHSFVDEASVQSQLVQAQAQLEEAAEKIADLESTKSKLLREAKLEQILAPLHGRKKEQMQFMLANVATSKLEEAYTNFIGRVLKEDAPAEETTLNESYVVTGDREPASQPKPQVDKYLELKKLAGIN